MTTRLIVFLFTTAFSFIVSAQTQTVKTWHDNAHTQLKETYTVIRINADSVVKHGKYVI
jgi:hypothetical protein